MELDYVDIGKRVRKFRDSRNFTQDELASRANLSKQHLSNIETANTKVSLVTLVKVANALDVSLDALLANSIYAAKPIHQDEFAELISGMNEREIKVILESAKSTLMALRRFYPSNDE